MAKYNSNQGTIAMAGFEDTIRKAVPGGDIAKPLMLALLALLASGVLFGKRDAGPSAGTDAQPTSDQGAGGLLGGLGGLLEKLQKEGLGNAINSWTGRGENQPVSPGQLGSALGPDIIKTCAALRHVRGRDYQAALADSAGGGRQAHPPRSPADRGGAVADDVNHARNITEEL
jgi:uncharacterized protein YidB (DUF937 family)